MPVSRPPGQKIAGFQASKAKFRGDAQGKDFADIAGLGLQVLESRVQASEFKVLGLGSRAQG